MTAACLLAPPSPIAEDVRRGLLGSPKSLPPYLFYDEAGSRLFDQITELPEYYLSRAERAILVEHSSTILERIARFESRPLSVIDLGAGSALKTQVLLKAASERHGRCPYVPVDVSGTALADAEERLRTELPAVAIQPLVMTHLESLPLLATIPAPRLVVFLGSSVGNLADHEASALFRQIRRALPGPTWLLVGTDMRKCPKVLQAAYDDLAGVTAAFNKNILLRINRELGGHFDLDGFAHVARWNDADSRVEMHLESLFTQEVRISGLNLRVRFLAGETIHTESCAKYDLPRVERLLAGGGFHLEATYLDAETNFGVHLAQAE